MQQLNNHTEQHKPTCLTRQSIRCCLKTRQQTSTCNHYNT